MRENPALMNGGPNANMTIQQMQQMGLRITQNVCGIVSAPIEYALRPWFGTRYFDPVQMLFTNGLMAGLPLAGLLTSHLPFGGDASTSSGIIGLGMLALLFFIGQAIHCVRIWRRIIDMNREQHSEYEGDALPFFALLPLGKVFWIVRIVWEPLLVIALAIAAHVTLVINGPAMAYLIAAAVSLSVKNALAWYQAWLHLRILLDAKFAGPLMAKAASGKATENELAQVHLAGFPPNIPADIRTAAIAEMSPRAASLPAEIASLVSPVDNEAA